MQDEEDEEEEDEPNKDNNDDSDYGAEEEEEGGAGFAPGPLCFIYFANTVHWVLGNLRISPWSL